jgi:hypothetical protein
MLDQVQGQDAAGMLHVADGEAKAGRTAFEFHSGDRLGKFLAQFPMFVFQRKWTTPSDWFQKIGGLDACSAGRLSAVDCVSFVRVGFVF